MIKLLIPQDKTQGKTTARGFWLDNGKVYYDYLRIEQGDFTLAQIKEIASAYNQLAVFFANEGEGFIYDTRKGSYDVLPQREQLIVNKKELRYFIQLFLRKYNGLTVYDLGSNYLLEVYHN